MASRELKEEETGVSATKIAMDGIAVIVNLSLIHIQLISAEQLQINQFREQNSPQKNRAKQIFYKFRAGQKLTAEELDFIAKEEPGTYRQIRQIMQERQMMEAQMEAAETKEEVAAIRLNEDVYKRQLLCVQYLLAGWEAEN